MREAILAVIREERWVSTWRLRCELAKRGHNIPNIALFKQLQQLQAEGIVKRHHYSASNNACWELAA
jgi:repressor of nif and glnA expression